MLLRDGLIGRNELARRVMATIADATLELLQAEVEGTVRFVPGERHWLGAIAPADLGALGPARAERLRRVPEPRRPRRSGSDRPAPRPAPGRAGK